MTSGGIAVDLSRNTVTVGDRTISLKAKEAEILHVVADGGVARYGHLISKVWCLDEPGDAYGAMKTHVCALRKKLAGTGFRFVTHHGIGFELVCDRPPRAGLLSALA